MRTNQGWLLLTGAVVGGLAVMAWASATNRFPARVLFRLVDFKLENVASTASEPGRSVGSAGPGLPAAEERPPRHVDGEPSLKIDESTLAELVQKAMKGGLEGLVVSLADIEAPGVRQSVAVRLVESVGFDDGWIEHIALMLPPLEVTNFRIAVIERRATLDLDGALQAAVPFGDVAIARVAFVGVRQNPMAAIDKADLLPLWHRETYKKKVLNAWAELDPSGVAEFLQGAHGKDIPLAIQAFEAFARQDAQTFLSKADSYAASVREKARAIALETLAETDVAAAMAYVDALPQGETRKRALISVVRSYGASDPSSAVAWLSARQEIAPDIVTAVLAGIGSADPELMFQTIDSAVRGSSPVMEFGLLEEVLPGLARDMAQRRSSEELAPVLDRLERVADSFGDRAASSAMSVWSRRDPHAALDWTLAQPHRLTEFRVRQIGTGLGTIDPEAARANIYRLPEEMRAAWVAGVSEGISGYNFDRAHEWALSLVEKGLRDAGVQAVDAQERMRANLRRPEE